MGRKRVKKSCTSCGFNHAESVKECTTPKEELEEANEELIGAMGDETPVKSPSPAGLDAEEADGISLPRRPDQTTLNEMASLENRMNSRLERFEALVVNLVSGAPSAATAAKAATESSAKAAPESKQ